MFCPNCKSEYREGVTHCAECGCPLVEALLPEPAPEPEEALRPRFLCAAADDFEAEVLLGKLRIEGIYAMKRYRGSDSYAKLILGRTVLGVEIWVAARDWAEARQILG